MAKKKKNNFSEVCLLKTSLVGYEFIDFRKPTQTSKYRKGSLIHLIRQNQHIVKKDSGLYTSCFPSCMTKNPKSVVNIKGQWPLDCLPYVLHAFRLPNCSFALTGWCWRQVLLHRNTKNVSRAVLSPSEGNKSIRSLCPRFAFTISLWILTYSRVYISLYSISLYIHKKISSGGSQPSRLLVQTATVWTTALHHYGRHRTEDDIDKVHSCMQTTANYMMLTLFWGMQCI